MTLRHVHILAAAIAVAPLTAQPTPRWSLTVTGRAGETGGPSLTDVRGLAANDSGYLFALDVETEEVLLYDATGRFVRRVTRRGRGPGELENGLGIARRPDGGFVINDDANARLTFWSASGEYQRQVPLISNFAPYAWEAGWSDPSHLVDRTLVRADGKSESRLRRINATTGAVDTLPMPDCAGPRAPTVTTFFGRGGRGPGMMVPFRGVQRRTIDDAGNVWCSPGDEYRIEQYRIGSARSVLTISAPGARETIPRAERDSAVAVVDSFGRRWPGGNVDSKLIPNVRPAVEGLFADDSGRLWVRRPAIAGVPTRFDIWQAGKLIARVSSPLRLAREIPFLVIGDRFYGVVLDDDDVQSIIIARIDKDPR